MIRVYPLRGVLGWSVDIMIKSFFVPTRHEHVTVHRFNNYNLPTSFDHRAAIFVRASKHTQCTKSVLK